LKNNDQQIDFPKPSEPYFTIATHKKRKNDDRLTLTTEERPWSADEITE
jgi:hypothetical protein